MSDICPPAPLKGTLFFVGSSCLWIAPKRDELAVLRVVSMFI